MLSFAAGIVTGCLIGVGVALFFVSLAFEFVKEPPRRAKGLPLLRFGLAGMAVLAVALVSRSLNLDRTTVALLLLLSVLSIDKLGGFATGMVATLVAAVAFSYLFLPPIGSLGVSLPGGQLHLTLFILIAILGSRLIEEAKRFTQRREAKAYRGTGA